MTEHVHDWGEWERVVEHHWEHVSGDDWLATPVPTGDRAHECRTCGRWEVEWAETEETK